MPEHAQSGGAFFRAFLASVFASIAINSRNSNEIFAGGGEPNYHDVSKSGIGIWRSTEAGEPKSWFKISSPEMEGQVIYKLIIDPVAPNNIYAATSDAVFLGTRGPGDAIDWTRLGQLGIFATDLAVDFSTTPRKVYAGVWGGEIWKYDGTNWHERDEGIDTANGGAVALTLSASSPAVLYTKIAKKNDNNKNNGELLGVYKTTTGAESLDASAWSIVPRAVVLNDSCYNDLCTVGYSWYNNVIAVDPTNADVVYAGGMNLYRSGDGGKTWNQVSNGADPDYPLSLHPDQHAIAFDPQESGNVFVGNDGGVFRVTGISSPVWRWNNISHGMVITEFYRIASQQATATLLAGGSQDNGTELTFGNRTWYNPNGCDGADVAVDGRNSDTLYGNCNGWLYLLANPVPQTPGGGTLVQWTAPADVKVKPPLVTDETIPGAAIASGTSLESPDGPQSLLKTNDGVTWNTIIPALPAKTVVSFIAIAPSSSFQAYYIGVGEPLGSIQPSIWRTSDGGLTWDKTATGLPENLWPAGAAVDYNDPSRAVAAFGGRAGGAVLLTTDAGNTWSNLFAGADEFIRQIPVTGVAIDPNGPNTIYAATRLGVFKGQIKPGAAPTAAWSPFDEGLPDGLDVNSILVNRSAGLISIGSMGHGVFQRDIRPDAKCSGAMLLVRDNVFDNGRTPSPQNIPDPEHPIIDPARPIFYRPNDTAGGQVFWWTSPDIRFTVPSTPTANRIAKPDHVEFESCPIETSSCPAGTIVDSPPIPGQPATVHLQVSNRGLKPASNVRVMALWADARNLTFPKLPNEFWTRTFPAGGTNCGPLDGSTGWNFVSPANPCQVIPVINPELPEVVSLPWNVPASVKSASILLLVESADDPIDPAVRAGNETRIFMLIPNVRQMALRNLQIIRAEANADVLTVFKVANVTASDIAVDLILSRDAVGNQDSLDLLVPMRNELTSKGLTLKQASSEFKTAAILLKANVKRLWQARLATNSTEGEIVQYKLRPLKSELFALIFNGPQMVEDQPSNRGSIVTKENGVVIGGITYIFRR
ncbi:MAG: WD40/YVTN/BNR-like repeat-containing protein [Pyrinomonadaceae bacterium]